MENVNWLAIVVGMVIAILYLSNVVPVAVGGAGLAVLIYGIFSSKGD